MSDSKIVVRPISSSDSLQELTELLHSAYKKLAEQGLQFLASHQNAEMTKQRIDDSETYVALLNNKLIGTISYRSPITKNKHAYYNQAHVASYGQFAVAPVFQKGGLGSRLIEIVENCARRDGAKEIAIDTAESATELIAYYKKRGYAFVMFAKWDTVNYRSVIMSKDLS